MTFQELHQQLERHGFTLRWERGSLRTYAKASSPHLIRLDYRSHQVVPTGLAQSLLHLAQAGSHARTPL